MKRLLLALLLCGCASTEKKPAAKIESLTQKATDLIIDRTLGPLGSALDGLKTKP